LLDSSNTTITTAAPLITEIETHLTACAVSLKALKAVSPLARRQSQADVAALVASIVGEVTTAVSTLGQTPATSLVGGLLPGLDTALGAVLSNVEVLVAGVLELVSTLCVLSTRMSISFADGLPTASSTSRASSRTLRSASPLARLVSKRLGCTHPSLKLEGLAPTETVIPCCIIDHKAYQP
jgi:hypothetical protein